MGTNELQLSQSSSVSTATQQDTLALDNQRMLASICSADYAVRMQHLADLEKMDIVPIAPQAAALAPENKVRLLHIGCLTYDEKEDTMEKLAGVFGAVSNYDASAVFIMRHDGEKIYLYMGTACQDPQALTMVFGTFERALKGNFPGCTCNVLSNSENKEVLSDMFEYQDNEHVSIASVSGFATRRGQDPTAFLQGMEKLADAMKGIPYALVVLASSLSHDTLARMRIGYENLYTELSPFHKQNASLSSSDTTGFSKTVGESISQSISMTNGTSYSTSETSGDSESTSMSKEFVTDEEKKVVGIGMLASLPGIFINPSLALLGNSITSNIQTLTGKKPGQRTIGTSSHKDKSVSDGKNESESKSESETQTDSSTDSTSRTDGKTMAYNLENRTIGTILEAIDEHIERLNVCEGNGAFQCAAYVVAADRPTAIMAASLYRSLLGEDINSKNACYVNAWQAKKDTNQLCEYLMHMQHPCFAAPGINNEIFEASPAVTVPATELPIHCSWPSKPLPGLTVTTHAEFARDIITETEDEGSAVKVGKIYHMGNTENCDVNISLKELRKHLFISGAPGSGKSNFCYVLLNRLAAAGVKFMVIEPAKGEYSSVFGGREDVNVYGTNSLLTPLLSVNPFEFPQGVHILEHLDRIIEVFNASWPMYAAMPALLKEGLEEAYRSCGWDLETGLCEHSPAIFPTFMTLLDIMPDLLKKTDYSQEVQGNYIGSLVTRIKSMTNGICGKIFCSDPIDDKKLFDENTIIDISRLGSAETKSLIMGIMIIRLQEYRSCNRNGINEELKHVTLLEEAHHLLRQTSTAQSMEGANLRGMSVEILTNAIAEMRTYGEGFLIADQTPSAMSEAVIGNTGIKVIFKLPNINDRIPVGNAVALSDEQIQEIAKLDTGVAVMYQSQWLNPVLCKIDYFPEEQFLPLQYVAHQVSNEELTNARTTAIRLVISGNDYPLPDYTEIEKAYRILCNSTLDSDKPLRAAVHLYLNQKETDSWLNFNKRCEIIAQTLDSASLLPLDDSDIDGWSRKATDCVKAAATLTDAETKTVLSMFIMYFKETELNARSFFFTWRQHLAKAKKKANSSENDSKPTKTTEK